MNRAERTRLLTGMIAAAAEAGTRIREMAAHGVVARSKADSSPVTDADEAAEAIIEHHLGMLLPGVPMIGEESVAQGSKTKPGSTFFLVDPIDGTREFVARRLEYTVNIGLLVEGTPLLGVIYAPALGELYAGGASGALRLALPAGRNPGEVTPAPISVRVPPPQRTAVVSHSHLDSATTAWLGRHGIEETVKAGSSIKFCRVAEGKADVYPRLAPVSEWDIAAGHAILMAAGGSVRSPEGTPLYYGKRKDNYGVKSFIAFGGAQF